VAFDYIVRTADRIAVFPRFVAFDISMLTRVQTPEGCPRLLHPGKRRALSVGRRAPAVWSFKVQPFSRCLCCNDVLRDVPKSTVDRLLLPRTSQHNDAFEVCSGCGRVYWKVSHWKRLKQAIDAARQEAERAAI
jgi:hypothetical protein